MYFIVDLLLLIVLATIPFFVIGYKTWKNKQIEEYKAKIDEALEKHKRNISFDAFFNINKLPWRVVELLPGVSRFQAKNVTVQIRKIRNIKTFDEFCKIIGLDEQYREINKKIIKFE